MMKAHCDNCDELVISDVATPARRLTIQPLGYQCVVTVTIRKDFSDRGSEQVLCARCLRASAIAFTESFPSATVGWGDTREKAE